MHFHERLFLVAHSESRVVLTISLLSDEHASRFLGNFLTKFHLSKRVRTLMKTNVEEESYRRFSWRSSFYAKRKFPGLWIDPPHFVTTYASKLQSRKEDSLYVWILFLSAKF